MAATEGKEKRNEIAEGLHKVALWIKYLGTGDNGDPRGAVEFLSCEVKDGLEAIAGAIRDHARAVDDLAGAVAQCAKATRDELGGINKSDCANVDKQLDL